MAGKGKEWAMDFLWLCNFYSRHNTTRHDTARHNRTIKLSFGLRCGIWAVVYCRVFGIGYKIGALLSCYIYHLPCFFFCVHNFVRLNTICVPFYRIEATQCHCNDKVQRWHLRYSGAWNDEHINLIINKIRNVGKVKHMYLHDSAFACDVQQVFCIH